MESPNLRKIQSLVWESYKLKRDHKVQDPISKDRRVTNFLTNMPVTDGERETHTQNRLKYLPAP